MTEHICISDTQVCILIYLISGHLAEHRTFEMNHLIMRKRQDVILALVIGHGEGHRIVIALSHNGIELHILAEIMHPAHVPLECKSESLSSDLARNIGPSGRFLRNGKESGICSANNRIEMLEKLYRIVILIAAIFIGKPLTVLLAIIKIEHRCNCIHSDTVNMEFPEPVEYVCYKEILDLCLGIVEYLGSPVGMLSEPRIRMLVNARSVELTESMSVGCKMCGNPIKDNSDAVLMKLIYKIHEIFGLAVSGGRSIIARHLISPGSVKGMLCNTHQFYMGILHLFEILYDPLCELSVIVESVFRAVGMLHEGSDVAFVDRHRLLAPVLLIAVLLPFGIFPFKSGKVSYYGCGTGSELCIVCIRICLVEFASVLGMDKELIHLTDFNTGDKYCPYAHITEFFHRMCGFIPAVK